MAAEKPEIVSDVDGKFLMYKGLPLVREDNVICYGDMSAPHVLQMIIMSEKEENGKKVPDKILIQILKTDKGISEMEKIVKQDMKSGFADAFEIGLIWLNKYNSK